MVEKFYVTTAIDYVSAEPHIGHAYQKIVADVLARWNKLKGKEVLFVTGTDEYGKKVEEAAEKAGKNSKEFVDDVSEKYKNAWKVLNIDYDRFIRTTDKDHQEVVKEFIEKCNKAGDIYKGKYTGNYCTGCELYVTDKDLVDGKCAVHPNREIEEISEETYFFKLSKYRNFLLDLYETDFTKPKIRRNEVKKRVQEGLNDLSISRTSFDWGIPFPLDKKHVTYVWFDALINYYTATREKNREEFWGEPTVHILGKDNTWFHNVYWPSMLKSAGIKLPKTTLNHGFLTFNGQKISKSLGNSISPVSLVEKYGVDAVRYFCLRQFPFATGEDGDFSETALVNRHNDELANKLGNLVSRVSGLIEKADIDVYTSNIVEDVGKLMDQFEFDKALNSIFAFIDTLNQFIQENKLWENKNKKDIYEVVSGIRLAAVLLWPFIPETSEEIARRFGFKISLEELSKPLKGVKIKKGKVLFEKIIKLEDKVSVSDSLKLKHVKGKPKVNKKEILNKSMENVATIGFEDFAKLDLRVAKITKVEEIDGADKLWKLSLDVGELGERTICAGIKEFYSAKELKGRAVVVVSNLAPRKLRGIESKGMLLAATSKDGKNISLISPDKDVGPGSVVG